MERSWLSLLSSSSKSRCRTQFRMILQMFLLQMWMVQCEESVPCIPPKLNIPSTVTSRPHQIIIAHRGASAHLPEHTVPAYRLALELGADYIEPDIVATKDNELIAIHTMDLNVTTDVAEKFPDRQTFSTYMNRTGYWTYNFELEEIKTLRVIQRLPNARSTEFDGLFGIPTLKQVLDLILKWDTEVEGLLTNSTISTRRRPGIYMEPKDFSWLMEDTKVDLIDIIFQKIQEDEDLWKAAIFDRLCYTQAQKIHEVRIPPLVVQSFEGNVLKSFTERWKQTFTTNNDEITTNKMPVPPTILLVNQKKCLEESFWFQIGDTWREYISGVGPEKACLYQGWREFMEEATRYNLVVHAWTERPELEYVGGDQTHFTTALEEVLYFFCKVKVHGIFSESVQVAVMAANMPCPDDKDRHNEKPEDSAGQQESKQDKGSFCYETEEEANLYLGLAAFTMGMFLSALVSLWLGRTHRRRGRRQLRVPTVEVADDGLEMT